MSVTLPTLPAQQSANGRTVSGPSTPVRPGPGRAAPRGARYVLGGFLLMLSALLLGLSAQLVLLSPLQHRAAQTAGFDELRAELAAGTAPVAQTDQEGRLLASGTPVLLLDIPRLHLHEVVFEGTDSDVLAQGPGLRRDTVLPGQAGTSVVMGRAAAYGGPFGPLHRLAPGDTITATTGQGVFAFRVLDQRLAGGHAPAPPVAGRGRLVLITASGPSYLPDGVLRIDADLVGRAADTPAAVVVPGSVPEAELPLRGGAAVWWELVLWLQALLAVSAAVVWAWFRWGRRQAWITAVPVVGFVGLHVAEQLTRLLPNLL